MKIDIMSGYGMIFFPLLCGALLDLFIGDPHSIPHPVRLIGALISGLEKMLRKLFPETPGGELTGGALLALLVPFSTGAVIYFLEHAVSMFGASALFLFRTILSCFLLAGRSLYDESMKVERALAKGDVEAARKAVSMIVGRDTQVLSEEGIAKAAVETVAENTSDGVIAPLIFLAAGGPMGGWIYKAVNTMDSMIGYKNDRYLYFGRAAARLDDLFNFIPARISALFMILAAFLTGEDGRGAFRIFLRDRYHHKSPNSAQTESVCAGALGLKLAGDAYYFGKLYKKPFIGDEKKKTEAGDIVRANKLMFCTELLTILAAALIAGSLGQLPFLAG